MPSSFVSPVANGFSGQPSKSDAQRRRERRLRSLLRHECMTVAMALAESTHHSSRGQRIARAGVWEREMNYTATIRDPPHPSRSSSASLQKSPAIPGQTGLLLCRGQRRTVQQIVDPVPSVPFGADRRHSNSWSWRANRWSSRFSPKTEFNSAACFSGMHF